MTAYTASKACVRGGSLWHRLAALLAVVPVVLLVAGLSAPAFAAGDYGPDTCLEGYVWREATPADHVCVTGAVRTQTAIDNSQAAARRSPTGGAYGPDTCLFGYVWREAVAGDHVCVTGATRSQAASDNSQAAARRGSLNTWHTTYTIPPVCNGDICTIKSTDEIPRFRLQGDHVDVGWVLIELRRVDTGVLRQSWYAYASPALVVPGGRFSLDTGVIDCARSHDSYFRVQDPSSRRWSTPHYVSAICAVL